MIRGRVAGIYITAQPGARLNEVREVAARAGAGLVGDRYGAGAGTFSKPDKPDRQVTLIEAEALEALRRDYEIDLTPADARRNVLTRGVALNHLVGREFRVGDVRLRGLRLCEPCKHLEGLTRPGVIRGLTHRGGLRAEILSDGVIRTGDVVEAPDV
jgi:MOSC domain-containing protein YiiM